MVSVGQFIARYGAREMARWEDTRGFLADVFRHLRFEIGRLQNRRHPYLQNPPSPLPKVASKLQRSAMSIARPSQQGRAFFFLRDL